MAIINQIAEIVNDAYKDALGVSTASQPRSTTDFVSMGEQLGAANAYDLWYNSLVNRLSKTVYAVRRYEAKRRGVLRDETEWGAFKQKVHYNLSDAVDNPAFKIPQVSGETRTYNQSSPYDVNTTLGVKVLMFGGQGTWSIEVIRPIAQIMTAFTGAAEMAAFIDGIYVYIENSYEVQIESIEALADNTAIARCLVKGKHRNLLTEYNATLPSGATALTAAGALTDPDFLRFASKEINDTIGFMADMSTLFNEAGMPKFTPRDRVVVEMLHQFTSASSTYLQSNTFHDELVALPNFIDVNKWQTGGTGYGFADTSKITIQHDDLIVDPENPEDTGAVTQSGIICFVKDLDAVAANFGERYTWEEMNKRDRVMIHGEQARKGYAVDPNENMIVFYVADAA
jgi:hypothetical protein